MSEIDARVGAYYTGRLREFGATPRGVDWNGTESQELRFAQLLRAVPRDGAVRVLDFGCGYGGFAGLLQRWNPQASYLGYDISAEMIAAARSRVTIPGYVFTSDRTELERADVLVASGVLNVKMDIAREEWEAHVFDLLAQFTTLADSAIAFNVLTSYADPQRMRDDLYYADPHRLFAWCREHFGPWVALLHDYGLYEFTIIARKQPISS